MLIFNADGSIARACGNACRCVAKILDKKEVGIQVHDRVVRVETQDKLYKVDMGVPQTQWFEIPLAKEMDTMEIIFNDPYNKIGACVNVGNPHLVFFEDNINVERFLEEGNYFEYHPLFPDRINVSFAKILSNNSIELKVWERGTGPTLACGSAACATHYIANKMGFVDKTSTIKQDGGELIVQTIGNSLYMIGPAEFSFIGQFSIVV